ncbi:CDP-glycerol glycerophosphotransferase family protein [Dethiobacter alkaliphilus]|uniref:CDP-glycerol glycerophosphotransferase family protein n=1 Tax=Dethiobacter alkaliphilus TaxID=427926 RepID=UPI002227FDDB|nr:CDP-glycerol glycerophosphotransferase family protein [Dethiobacter alkaliphilus]MCW3488830.1 CDP-glycerol glycerophosphotransferase family protein [Dethiobacter alkaliphilus]
MYLISHSIFFIVDVVIPKKEGIYIIASHLGIVGNARFLSDYILENGNADKKIYIYSLRNETRSTDHYFEERYKERLTIIKKRGFKALCIALQAKYIFVSHDVIRDVGFPLGSLKNRRVIVNLWHGIATKKHWLTEKQVCTNHSSKAKQFSKIVASSAVDAIAKAATFHKSLEDVWITGNPRNDILIGKNNLPRDLLQQELDLFELTNGKSLILYAPTWRSYQHHFQPFDDNSMGNLICMLNKYNAVLGLRLHEKDELKFKKLYQIYPNILNLGQRKFPETQLLLKNAQVLVTDYSSIWLDYLLTDNPIIAFWYDFDCYYEKRGTLWDLAQLFPGEKVKNCNELINAIDNALSRDIGDKDKQQYNFVKSLFHKYTDGKNAERVAKKVGQVD